MLAVVTFGEVPFPLKVHPLIVAVPPWRSSPSPSCTPSNWLLLAVRLPPRFTTTPSCWVPSVLMFWTVTDERRRSVRGRSTARNQTFLMVMLPAWKTFRPSPEDGARCSTWFAAPMIVRLLLLFTAAVWVYTPGARMIVALGLARLIATVKLPRGGRAFLPAPAPSFPVGATKIVAGAFAAFLTAGVDVRIFMVNRMGQPILMPGVLGHDQGMRDRSNPRDAAIVNGQSRTSRDSAPGFRRCQERRGRSPPVMRWRYPDQDSKWVRGSSCHLRIPLVMDVFAITRPVVSGYRPCRSAPSMCRVWHDGLVVERRGLPHNIASGGHISESRVLSPIVTIGGKLQPDDTSIIRSSRIVPGPFLQGSPWHGHKNRGWAAILGRIGLTEVRIQGNCARVRMWPCLGSIPGAGRDAAACPEEGR